MCPSESSNTLSSFRSRYTIPGQKRYIYPEITAIKRLEKKIPSKYFFFCFQFLIHVHLSIMGCLHEYHYYWEHYSFPLMLYSLGQNKSIGLALGIGLGSWSLCTRTGSCPHLFSLYSETRATKNLKGIKTGGHNINKLW